MPKYEYKVVPAPKKAGKIKGIKGTDERFAAEISKMMNEFGAEGWEYQRTDTLPCEERQGFTGRTTTFQTMLIFRRSAPAAGAETADTTAESANVEMPSFRASPPPIPTPEPPVAPVSIAPAAEGAPPRIKTQEGEAPQLAAQ